MLAAASLLLALTSSAAASPLVPAIVGRDVVAARADDILNATSSHPQVTVTHNGTHTHCHVKPLGGAQDDSPALISAFDTCASDSVVQLDGFYVVGQVLNTTLTNVEVELSGAIQYTPDMPYWIPNSIYLTYQNATTFWLFSGKNVTLTGGGTIDGNGMIWWTAFAENNNRGVAGGSSREFARPIPLVVGNAKGVTIRDLQIVQSPFWHNLIYQSEDVLYENIRISSKSYNASIKNANSDGWDIYRSSGVTIRNVHADVGDDCVSLKPNATNVFLENLWCNGSHGISIGSLGQYAGETDVVENVFVRNVTMLNAENGARIKVFGGSDYPASISGGGSGFVRNVTFEDFIIENVDRPILIDQCYSTDADQCIAHPSTLSISDIHYRNFTGVSSGIVPEVVSLQCSALCTSITAEDVYLAPANGTVEDGRWICVNIENVGALNHPCDAAPL